MGTLELYQHQILIRWEGCPNYHHVSGISRPARGYGNMVGILLDQRYHLFVLSNGDATPLADARQLASPRPASLHYLAYAHSIRISVASNVKEVV